MGMLVDGKWTENEQAFRPDGAFVRAAAAFRLKIGVVANAADAERKPRRVIVMSWFPEA